jgi:hypothetical protein
MIMNDILDTPACNERFCVIAAVSPQIMQWELASYCPAGSSVEAATTQSRHHVKCKFFSENAGGKM